MNDIETLREHYPTLFGFRARYEKRKVRDFDAQAQAVLDAIAAARRRPR